MPCVRTPKNDKARILPEGWRLDPEAGREQLYRQADAYREHLLRLATVQPVDAVPNDIGRILYDELGMIDRYDGFLFLTKLGVMYLKSRGLI